ncbi:MAG: CoA pyrophosphatase [Proteobacteria bacterium]|nr:MAG: CoA pyrophosphatase [Pseudomonadota bacterium]
MHDRIAQWLNSKPDTEVSALPMSAGDYRLNPTAPVRTGYTQAAVLVPLVDRPEGMTVLLTLRTEHLNDHAGQVSFPGGRVEPSDRSTIETALRETEEEIGVGRQHIQVLGYLDRYRTVTGFDIEPVVGVVTPGFTLKPDPFEVAEIFEVSLELVLCEESFRRETLLHKGCERHFYEIPHKRHHIWGATAGILRTLCLRAQATVG